MFLHSPRSTLKEACRQEHYHRGSLLQQAVSTVHESIEAPEGFDPLSIGLSEEHVHVKDQTAPLSMPT
jgi:hypothetical protein